MKTLFLVHKPYAALAQANSLMASHRFADSDILIGFCDHILGRLEYDLPRGLRYRDFPFTGPVRYRNRTSDTLSVDWHAMLYLPEKRGGDWHSIVAAATPPLATKRLTHNLYHGRPGNAFSEPLTVVPGDVPDALTTTAKIMAQADEIILLPGDFGRDVLRQYQFANVLRGHKPGELKETFEAFVPLDYSEAGIQRILDGSPILANAAEENVQSGLVREHFDWLYAVNSLAIFSPVLRRNGVPEGQHFLSKYGLLTLWLIADNGSGTEGNIHHLMSHHSGTGKYPKERSSYPAIGSAASRSIIMEQLVSAGLLDRRPSTERAPQGVSSPILSLSERGRQVLADLHPKTFDPDLPFRLHEWSKVGIAKASPLIERYVKVLFGRQIRYTVARHRSSPLDGF